MVYLHTGARLHLRLSHSIPLQLLLLFLQLSANCTLPRVNHPVHSRHVPVELVHSNRGDGESDRVRVRYTTSRFSRTPCTPKGRNTALNNTNTRLRNRISHHSPLIGVATDFGLRRVNCEAVVNLGSRLELCLCQCVHRLLITHDCSHIRHVW